MALPLIPILIGTAAGAALNYFLTNQRFHKQFSDTAEELGDSIQSGANKARNVMSDVVEDVSQTAQEATEAVKEAVDDATEVVKDVVDDTTEAVKEASTKVTE